MSASGTLKVQLHLASAILRGVIADAGGKGAQIIGGVGGDTDALYIAEFHIGYGKGATVRQGGGVLAAITIGDFNHRAADIRGDTNGRCIVSTGNGYCDLLSHATAITITDGDGVVLSHHLTFAQVINVRIRHAKGPAHLASAILRGVIADAGGKGAQITGGVGGDTDALYIAEIHIGNSKRTTVRQGWRCSHQ